MVPHTVYRLSLELTPEAKNLYTVFGVDGSPMAMPPVRAPSPRDLKSTYRPPPETSNQLLGHGVLHELVR